MLGNTLNELQYFQHIQSVIIFLSGSA